MPALVANEVSDKSGKVKCVEQGQCQHRSPARRDVGEVRTGVLYGKQVS